MESNLLLYKYFNIKKEYFNVDDGIEYNISIPNNDNLIYFMQISEENYNFYYYIINPFDFTWGVGLYYLISHNLFQGGAISEIEVLII